MAEYGWLIVALREYAEKQREQLIYEAADAIEELSLIAESNARGASMWAETAGKAVEQIPRWIPVTERLPKKRKWVLCRCEANIVEVLRWENNEWYHDPMHVYYPSFVTHWQPLPEPPKEEA